MEQENLIQIMAYRESLNKETGRPFTWQNHFDNIKVTSALKLFQNLDKIIDLIPENDRWNCHYTIANCYPTNKTKEKPLRVFHHQEMIAFDVDGNVDIKKESEYREVIGRVCGIDTSKLFIGCSGNGLHYCMVLKDHIDSITRYKNHLIALAKLINKEITLKGLSGSVDTQRFTESATLRLIGTKNIKKGIEKDSYVIQNNVEEVDFDITKIIDLPLEEYEEVTYKLRPVDYKAVTSGCKFLVSCLEEPHTVKEPQWYAMLGILAYIPDIGETLCHTYSNKHPDYNVEETNEKIKHALKLKKPRTCDSINQVYSKCSECPYYEKVKTPLQIKSEEFIPTESTGFHNEIKDKNGNTKFVPNFEDLLKFFTRQHIFVVDKNTRQVSIFNGTHWTSFTDLEVEAFATKHFNPIATINKRSEFKSLVVTSNLVDSSFFGKDNSGFVNFKNGVLKLSTKELLLHSPDFGFNYVLPYDYNPYAKCPEFDKMMDNVTVKDMDMQNLLLEYVAYAISGMKASFGAKALILTGGGSNGKSTFLNVIKMLIGRDCFSTVSLEDMSDPNNRYSMVGRLFNICEEVEENELRKGTAIFKSIVTGADLMVKKLYSDTVSMRIDTKLILSCNDLPTSRENTYAIYRRMLIVPFKAKFKKETGIDKHIEERIALEMSGVYNRVLEAYDRFIKNNGIFSESEAANEALKEYTYNNSFYNQFADAHLESGNRDNDFLSSDELMTTFKQWAELNNVHLRPTPNKLARELKTIGVLTGDSGVKRINNQNKRGYWGLKKINNSIF